MASVERHRASTGPAVTACTVTALLCLALAAGTAGHAADPLAGRFALQGSSPAVSLPVSGPAGSMLRTTDLDAEIRADHTLRLPGQRGSRFVHEHLVPELTSRFRPLSNRSTLGVLGLGAPDSNASREFTDLAANDAGKAAERAVTEWLLAITDIEARALRWVARPRERLGLDGERESSSTSRLRPSISVGFSHGLPRTGLKWAVGEFSTLRVTVKAYGAAEIEFGRGGVRRERWVAGWDGERDRYRMQYRITF